MESARPITVFRSLLWLGAIVVALVGLDLAQRFLFYDIRPRDRRSVLRMVRRPIKDTLLRGIHGLPTDPFDEELVEERHLPVFDLYLKPRDEELLRSHMTQVQLIGTHDELTRSWIPGRMSVDGQDYDVRVKLRGRQHYHVVRPRPSLRVRVRRGQSYRGATVFNLLEPFDKTGDQTFMWESEQHGLIGWDTTMGYLAMRGEPISVVHYVEQVRRATGDRNGRPEGMFFRGTGDHYSEGADPERCGAVVERVAGWLADTETTIPFEDLRATFDLERLCWFSALTEFSGDLHGFADFNMKGFCDPVSIKAEFLMWDTRFGDWSSIATSGFAEMGTQFLRDDRYRLLHDATLYELATERVEPMIERALAFYDENEALLGKDLLRFFPRGGPDGGFVMDRPAKLARTLRKNAVDIRAALEGERLLWELDGPGRVIRVSTPDRGAKRVTALLVHDGDGAGELPLPRPVDVPGRFRDRQPVVPVALPEGVEAAAVLGLVSHNVHTGRAVTPERSDAPLEGVLVPPAAPQRGPLPQLPPGFAPDPERGSIVVGPGDVRLDSHLLLPEGWGVELRAGTTLALGPGTLFEIRGPFHALGTPDAPIEVRAAGEVRATGEETWGAVAVFGERTAPVEVELKHTRFLGGAGSNAGAARYTGSFAAYFADVVMEHMTIDGGFADDAVNLKFCSVRAADCTYLNGAGDAVDYDFCSGTDLRTHVEGFADDGIDLSGSRVRIEDAVLTRIGDKAVSVGEASRPELVGLRVDAANMGCAVKDSSVARVERLTVMHSNTAVALYRKKMSFGPPRAVFSDLVVADVGAFAIVDHGGEVSFENALRLEERDRIARPFDGVTNVSVEGLDDLSVEEVRDLARREAEAAREF